MNPSESSASISPAQPTLACVACSDRKVKCDRQTPCSACVRHNVQCVFRPRKQSRKKRKFELVDERLKRYEALLQEKGIDPNQVTDIPQAEAHRQRSRTGVPRTVWQLPTPASSVSMPQATIFEPQLIHGQSGTKLVDNSLWSRVAEEIDEAADPPEEDSENDASDGEVSKNNDFGYVLGLKRPITLCPHPAPKLIHHLWQVFTENVNPLSKLVHVPSLQPAIEKAIATIEHIPRGFEALMFAIYSMAVKSLTDDECKDVLGETREVLLLRCVAATKAALYRAKFLSSTSIVVLQALLLHILSIRDIYEPRAVWNFTGVVIRIAEGMGMRLDGTLLGLSPFETEIRRRIWWQLKIHDFRAAELSGQAKVRAFDFDENSPKPPANVNDVDLYPTMLQAAAESSEPTEMIWCMLRSDLANFAVTQRIKMNKTGKAIFTSEEYPAMDDLDVKESFIKHFEEMIETKYLRFCDPSQPLQLVTLLGARALTNVARFQAHHPRRWAKLDDVPVSEQQLVWNIVIKLLEQYNMMQSSPQLRRFAWNMPYSIQWHAVIHVLDTLRADPLHQDAVKTWRLIDALYENNLEMLLSIKRPIFVAVGNLCLKAYSARVAATREKGNSSDPPAYIVKLRGQREVAEAKREAVIARSEGIQTLDRENRVVRTNNDAGWSDTNPRPADASSDSHSQQNSIVQNPLNPVQGSIRTEDDAFWLSEALDDSHCTGGATDLMNLDTDALLTQDWLKVSNDEVIDWTQWDAWFGNLDPVRPGVSAGPG